MANGSTNIGVRPTQAVSTNFGDIAQRGLDNAARVRQERRIDQERQYKKFKDFQDQYGIDESQFVLDDTFSRTLNDTVTEALSNYRDRLYDVHVQLQQDPTNVDLKKRFGKIQNSVKKIGMVHEKFKEYGTKGLEMLENDQISGVDEDAWTSRVSKYENMNVGVNINDKDDMEILLYDDEGNLDEVIPSYGSMADFNIIPKVDLDTELDDFVESIGRDNIEELRGNMFVTEDTFGEGQSSFVSQYIDSWLGTDSNSLKDNDVLADILNQATNGESKKRNNFTEEDREIARDFLFDQIRGRFDTEITMQQRTSSGSGSGRSSKDSTANIFPATNNGVPEVDNSGNFVFSLDSPRALTAAKSDIRIQSLKGSADGRITLVGEDREKVKGNPQSPEEAAEVANVPLEKIFSSQGNNGVVTYYLRNPFSVTYKSGENNEEAKRLINAFAGQVGYKNEDGLRDAMYQAFIEEFGQEEADRYFGGDLTPTVQQPTPAPTGGAARFNPN